MLLSQASVKARRSSKHTPLQRKRLSQLLELSRPLQWKVEVVVWSRFYQQLFELALKSSIESDLRVRVISMYKPHQVWKPVLEVGAFQLNSAGMAVFRPLWGGLWASTTFLMPSNAGSISRSKFPNPFSKLGEIFYRLAFPVPFFPFWILHHKKMSKKY